ncbi:MAG: AbrB/MazE/SpoVT family DNA-binding domain-containing protein [Thermoanaerobaculia bacterium]
MKITERGQLTLPKRLRDKYGITPRTELELLDAEKGILIVKKLHLSHFQKFLGRANARGLPRRTEEFLNLIRDGK